MTNETEKCWFCTKSSEEGCWALIRLDKNIGKTMYSENLDEEGLRYEDFQLSESKFTGTGVKTETDWYRYAVSEIAVPRCAECENAHIRFKTKVNLLRLLFSVLTTIFLMKLYIDFSFPSVEWLEVLIVGIIIAVILYLLPYFRMLSKLILITIGVNSIRKARNYPKVSEKLKAGFWVNDEATS